MAPQRFEILAHGVVIGHSELEHGDPPMGVAGGCFVPTPRYAKVQPAVAAALQGSQAHLLLAARLVGGEAIPVVGGIHISDYGDVLEVSVFGIGYPLYEELFPHHVAAYKAQFAETSTDPAES